MGTEIVKLKSNRGGEYTSTKFLEYLKDSGVEVERGPDDRPQANSVSERFNLTILSKIRTQLLESGLPLHLWGEAAMYSSLQINCIPSISIKFEIPIRLLENLSPTHVHPFDVHRLKPFGSLCFALDRKRVSKVSPTARRFIFVGIESNARAVRLWDKSTSRILVTGDVIHREDNFPARDPTLSPPVMQDFTFPDLSDQGPAILKSPTTIAEEYSALSHSNSPTSVNATSPDATFTQTPIINASDNPSPTPEPVTLTPPDPDPSPSLRRSSRSTAVPDRYGFSATTGQDPDHPTFSQAMSGPDRKAWEKAMRDKFDSLVEHRVGTLVDPPPNANVIGGMWIFNKKRDEHNRVVRFKARWVVFGNHQIKGIDYMDTYASVGKIDSLRILIAYASSRRMRI